MRGDCASDETQIGRAARFGFFAGSVEVSFWSSNLYFLAAAGDIVLKDASMKIDEATYMKMPAHLQSLFLKVPNPDCEEVRAGFPVTGKSKSAPRGGVQRYDPADLAAKRPKGGNEIRGHDDSGGSAARFFYTAKASKADREPGNSHPCVKPTDLMRYLCRLVTPPGGIVFDPFCGSGSTGKAAVLEGFEFIGIEQDAAYVEIARNRIARACQEHNSGSLFTRTPDS